MHRISAPARASDTMAEQDHSARPVIDLDADTVAGGLADGSMLVIDVREPDEFAAGHIPGSLSLPLSQLEAADIPAEMGKRIVFSCLAGGRSLKALALARSGGLPLDEHYGGGFRDWFGAGRPVEQGF